MDPHFLADHVDGEPGFEAGLRYNPYGDCLECTTKNEGVAADRIDEVFTLYRSAVDEQVIGFQIKGVGAICEMLDADAIRVEVRAQNQVVRHVRVELVGTAAMRKAFQDRSAQRRLAIHANLMGFVSTLSDREKEVAIPSPPRAERSSLAGAST